jgi:hypothetical protein
LGHHWSGGCCTASIMPRPGLRVTPTVTVHRTARSRNVPWPPQRSSGARQSPANGKRLQMSHPFRPCQERQGEDGLPPVEDAGNQQGQGLDGGEFASYPDAKLESHRLRRRQGKYILRHEEQLPEQSKVRQTSSCLACECWWLEGFHRC